MTSHQKKPTKPKLKIKRFHSISIKSHDFKNTIFSTVCLFNIEAFETSKSTQPTRASRRYSEFFWLNERLKFVPGVFLSSFPEKVILEKNAEHILEDRQHSFDIYLKRLNEIDNQFINSELNFFVRAKDDELKLKMKNEPSLVPKLPGTSNFLVNLFSSNKIDAKPFLDWAKRIAEEFSLDVSAILKKDEISIEEVQLPEDNELEQEIFLSDSKAVFEKLEENFVELTDAADMIVDRDENPMMNKEATNEHIESIFSNFKIDGKKKDRKNIRIMNEAINNWNSMTKSYNDGIYELAEIFSQIKNKVFYISNFTTEVDRMKKQFTEFNLMKSNSDIKGKEYQNLSLNTKSLGEKKTYEEMLKQMKYYNKAVKILIVVFAKNFTDNYKVYVEKKESFNSELYSNVAKDLDKKLEKIENDLVRIQKVSAESGVEGLSLSEDK